MSRLLLIGLLSIVTGLPGMAFAQTRSVQAELLNTIKVKKAKVGDPVKARVVNSVTLANGVTVASDSVILGEVRSADANSVVISFDRVDFKGKKTPLILSIRAAMMPGVDTSNTARKLNAQNGSVIGMPDVTLQVDESPAHASKFESESKNFELKHGLQLMLAPPEAAAQ